MSRLLLARVAVRVIWELSEYIPKYTVDNVGLTD